MLQSKPSSPYMPEFSVYHAANEYYKKRLSLNSIFLAFETEMLVKFSLLYATTKVQIDFCCPIDNCIYCVP